MPADPRPLPDLPGTPVLLLSGRYDELIPVEQAGLLAALLGEAGADVTYEVLPSGHELTAEDQKVLGDPEQHRREINEIEELRRFSDC